MCPVAMRCSVIYTNSFASVKHPQVTLKKQRQKAEKSNKPLEENAWKWTAIGKNYAVRIFRQLLPNPLHSLHPLAPLSRPGKSNNISNSNLLHTRSALEWQVHSVQCSVQVVSEQTPSIDPHYIGQGGVQLSFFSAVSCSTQTRWQWQGPRRYPSVSLLSRDYKQCRQENAAPESALAQSLYLVWLWCCY